MLTEDTRLWVRRKGWFLTHSNSNKQNIILFWCQFSKIQFSQDGVPTASRRFHLHWVLLQEKNSELKNSKSFNLACKQNCPIFSHTKILSLLYWTVKNLLFAVAEEMISVFQGCLLCPRPSNAVWNKRTITASVLITGRNVREIWRTVLQHSDPEVSQELLHYNATTGKNYP